MRTFTNILLYCTSLLLIINAGFYVFDAFTYTVQADDYRLTQLHIMPWFDGSWQIGSLWGDVHPNPIHGIVLIASASLENMTFASLPVIIIIAMLLKSWGYVAAINATDSRIDVCKPVLVFFLVLVIFSFNATMQYRWNSVGIAQIYHAIGAAYLVGLVYFLKKPSNSNTIILFVLGFTFQLVARQYSLPWLVASLTVITGAFILRQDKTINTLARFVIVLIAILVLEKITHTLLGVESIASNGSFDWSTLYDNWLSRPAELIKYLAAAIASSAVNLVFLERELGLSTNVVLLIAFGILLLYLLAALICLANIGHPLFKVLLACMLFTSLTIVAGIVYRTDASTTWLQGYIPRYVSFRDISAFAVLWVFAYQWLVGQKRWAAGVTICLVTAVVFMQYQYVHYGWRFIPYQQAYEARVQKELRFVGDYLTSIPDASAEEIQAGFEQKYQQKLNLNIGRDSYLNGNQRLAIILFWKNKNLNVFQSKN